MKNGTNLTLFHQRNHKYRLIHKIYGVQLPAFIVNAFFSKQIGFQRRRRLRWNINNLQNSAKNGNSHNASVSIDALLNEDEDDLLQIEVGNNLVSDCEDNPSELNYILNVYYINKNIDPFS